MADYGTITVNLDKRCAECRKGGATACGLCLGCATKAMDPRHVMKSVEGREVQARWKRTLPKGGSK